MPISNRNGSETKERPWAANEHIAVTDESANIGRR